MNIKLAALQGSGIFGLRSASVGAKHVPLAHSTPCGSHQISMQAWLLGALPAEIKKFSRIVKMPDIMPGIPFVKNGFPGSKPGIRHFSFLINSITHCCIYFSACAFDREKIFIISLTICSPDLPTS
ncbi:hypothetical protein, partial [Eisenbergiella massiliensis]|uniref:hypothetical protein n=1 Tax=Eisenbergiella massiliensis TaxID=1720294 RepID=UPI0023F33AD3